MISAEARRHDAGALALSLLSGAADGSVDAEYFTQLVLALYRLDDHLSGRTSAEPLEEFYALARDGEERRLPRALRRYLRAVTDHLRTATPPRSLEREAWLDCVPSAEAAAVPSMIDPAAKQYYTWIGSRMSGAGDAVEIGCWMGGSTCCLAEGLKTGGAFPGRRLYAFDSFVWWPWMAAFARRERMDASALSPGSSFLDWFLEECSAHLDLVHPVVVEFGEGTPALHTWEGGDIELFVYDMGPDRDMLEETWRVFSPNFLPGVTHVVFHEYAKLGSTDLWRFCAERSGELRPLHKPVGSAQGFLFDPDRLRGERL